MKFSEFTFTELKELWAILQSSPRDNKIKRALWDLLDAEIERRG